MRIAHYKPGGVEVTLDAQELTALGYTDDTMVTPSINQKSDSEWVKIELDQNGRYRFSPPRASGNRSIRFRPEGNGAKMQYFGAEAVTGWSKERGVIYGRKPKMHIPIIQRTVVNRRSPVQASANARDASFQCVHDAVKIINNFATKHDDLELAIVEGRLVVRMYIEFGK